MSWTNLWLGVEALRAFRQRLAMARTRMTLSLADDAQTATTKAEHGVGLLEGVELGEQGALPVQSCRVHSSQRFNPQAVARAVEELVQRWHHRSRRTMTVLPSMALNMP